MEINEITIVCLGAYGDIINSTPIAKHYKKEGKFVRWVAKDRYISVLKNNDCIDELLTLNNSISNNVLLTNKFKSLYLPKEKEKVIYTAPYMSKFYDGTPRSTLLDIIKNETSNISKWNCEFKPTIGLSKDEVNEAKAFISLVEGENKILVEFENFSDQTFFDKKVLNELFRKISGSFILTGLKKPDWFEELKTLYPDSKFYFYNGSFKSNAEIYNHCNLFIGCCSGITCLTSSDYCFNSEVNRIECCNGPHWSSMAWEHNNKNKTLCFCEEDFKHALEML